MLTDPNWLQILSFFALGLCPSWALIVIILKWSKRRCDAIAGENSIILTRRLYHDLEELP